MKLSLVVLCVRNVSAALRTLRRKGKVARTGHRYHPLWLVAR